MSTTNVLFLEIWIRKGKEEFGCLKLIEGHKDEIRYENSRFLEKTLKNYYHCRRSLEYEKHNSRQE